MKYQYDSQKRQKKKLVSGCTDMTAILDCVSITPYFVLEIPKNANNGIFLPRPCVGYERAIVGFPQLLPSDARGIQFRAEFRKVCCL